jgi:hypothetical protein
VVETVYQCLLEHFGGTSDHFAPFCGNQQGGDLRSQPGTGRITSFIIYHGHAVLRIMLKRLLWLGKTRTACTPMNMNLFQVSDIINNIRFSYIIFGFVALRLVACFEEEVTVNVDR